MLLAGGGGLATIGGSADRERREPRAPSEIFAWITYGCNRLVGPRKAAASGGRPNDARD